MLHDLAESKIGDHTPEQLSKEEKNKLENNAFNEIIKNLPDLIKSQYLQIWQEYQENNSLESKIVHQIDKLEMVLQAKIYEKDGHSQEKLESFFESARIDITDPKLKELFTKIIKDMSKNMSERSKDELIDAQKQVIGILFEVIKRLQANNDLDEEYFQMIKKDNKNEIRLKEILNERTENAKIVGRLLEQLET